MKGINEFKSKIFISSAQRNEGDICWAKVRNQIKTFLEEKGPFNVFIIEDSSAGSSSEEFMLRQVGVSDIIIILIGNELREGTLKEYREAIRRQKRIFVYFFNTKDKQASKEIDELKKEIRDNDYGLYKTIEDVKELEIRLYNDLLTDAWTTYLDKNTKELQRVHDIEKDMLKPYSSAYDNHKYELNVTKESKINTSDYYQNFAKTMQEFLLTGELNIQLKDETQILEKIYNGDQVLYNRFRAFVQYVNNNKEKSLNILKEILNNTKSERIDTWLKSNILIDCRNLQDEFNKKEGLFIGKNEYQEVIDNENNMVYFPADDRYLNNIYENIRKEELKKKSESPMSFSFGTGFNECLDLFQSYYFTAILYGSITHILKSREVLINILYKYSMLYNIDAYIFTIFKLLVLNGNVKDIKHYNTILSKKFRIDFAKLSKELWVILRNTCINQRMTRISIVRTYAMYFDDDIMQEVLDFLDSIFPEDYLYLSDYLKCIESIMQRIQQEKVIRLIIKLFDKKLIEGKEIANILVRINIKNVEDNVLVSLNDSLMKNADEIIERGGTPQFVVNLLYQNKEMFIDLANRVYGKMSEEDKHYYNINMGNENCNSDYLDLLNSDIKCINSIISQRNNGVFSSQLYDIVKSINDTILVESVVIDKVKLQNIYDLLIDLLKLKNDIGLAEFIADCLISIAIKCKRMNIECDFINVEKDLNLRNLNDMLWSQGTLNSIDIKVFCLRCLLGQILKEDINDIYYNYSDYTDYEKGVLSHTLFRIIPYIQSQRNEFVNLIYIMSSDNYYYVRYNVLECLPYYENVIKKDRMVKLIDKFVNDENRNVKITLLNMCKANKFDDKLKEYILEKLSVDSDYEIRTNAN